MTFDELKQIKDEASRASAEARYNKDAADAIGKVRRGYMPELAEITLPFPTGYNSGRNNLSGRAEKAIKQALLEFLPDILRLAEMRLEAEHKYQAGLCRAKESQLATYLGEPQ